MGKLYDESIRLTQITF